MTPEARKATGVAAAPRLSLTDLLREAVQRRASDLHLHSGEPVRWRIDGELVMEPDSRLSAQDSEAFANSILDQEQRKELHQSGQVDLAYTLPGLARFRVNVYRQQHGVDAVFRIVPLEPPTLSSLGLPMSLAKFANFHQGLVLITGPSGCGKSSTLAAFVSLINGERRSHIITIEDPIEYLHAPLRSVVNQRQVARHTQSFARALRAAMREDPDVIVIGELRDRETISLALTAAETGHLVLGTLHTTNAISTINRVVGVFPPSQLSQIRTMVSESLRGVLSQRLLKKKDGSGRVPVLEVMPCNRAISNLIRENKTFQIRSIMQTGGSQGMRLLDHALRDLVKEGTVRREDALRYCEDPKVLAAA